MRWVDRTFNLPTSFAEYLSKTRLQVRLKKVKTIKHDERIAKLVSLPAVILILFLIAVPFGMILYSSFQNISFSHIFGEKFVGLSNYKYTLTNSYFLYSIFITLVFSFATVFLTYVVGLFSAIFLNNEFPFKRIIFVFCLIPWAMPLVPCAIIWKWMLNKTYGVINWLVLEIGLSPEMLDWFTDRWLALLAIIFITAWREYAIALLMIYASLKNIPNEQYESARMDGSNKWQETFFITIPNVRSVSFMIIILQLLSSFRAVTAIYILTGGGPLRSTETLALHTFIEAFEYYNFGEASAAGVLTMIIIYLIIFSALKLTKRRDI
jgi:multiple sugar transport system permease protein